MVSLLNTVNDVKHRSVSQFTRAKKHPITVPEARTPFHQPQATHILFLCVYCFRLYQSDIRMILLHKKINRNNSPNLMKNIPPEIMPIKPTHCKIIERRRRCKNQNGFEAVLVTTQKTDLIIASLIQKGFKFRNVISERVLDKLTLLSKLSFQAFLSKACPDLGSQLAPGVQRMRKAIQSGNHYTRKIAPMRALAAGV